jgi:hypothetical protein
MSELRHLTQADIDAVSSAARRLSANHPSSARGISLEQAREKLDQSAADRLSLETAIRLLSKEAQCELLALMWFGRGDSTQSFEELLTEARRQHSGETVLYIAEKSSALSSYLRRGVERLSPT